MRPPLAVFNSADGAFSNAIVGGYLALKPRISTNGGNLRFGQLGTSATLAPVRSSMLGTVALIAFWRIPTQVFKAIVPRVAIVVAALQANGSKANKSSQNQRMRFKDFDFVVFPQAHERAIVLLVKRICFDLARFYGANVSMIRNFIDFFKTNYRQPTFHKSPLMLHMGIVA